jgi:hypothetical protein
MITPMNRIPESAMRNAVLTERATPRDERLAQFAAEIGDHSTSGRVLIEAQEHGHRGQLSVSLERILDNGETNLVFETGGDVVGDVVHHAREIRITLATPESIELVVRALLQLIASPDAADVVDAIGGEYRPRATG